ncbi:hypothetical protein D3C83_307590 [compost metagenome]
MQFCRTGTRAMPEWSRSVITTGVETLSSKLRFSLRAVMRMPRRVMPRNSALATSGSPFTA